MTPEQLTEELKAVYGDTLKSVALYGSAAAGDHAGKRSDYNVLVLLEKAGLPELKAFAKTTRAWIKKGNPPPLFFTPESFARSTDAFAMEFSDIRDSHKILFGQDPFQGLAIDDHFLRLELEHELKGKWLQLRERYLLAAGNPRDLTELMIGSLSTFLVLFRNSLRLFQKDVPARKRTAMESLATHVPFDKEVFLTLEKMKEGQKIRIEPEEFFERYLKAIERVLEAVDSHLHAEGRK
ncbi:MAG: nucleotidyltransferase domain-containing protein [Elusimicrobia bacterium]|nr:nucleotidyltransferase domain-containing protein [Elusimicrobiota bacterium]